MTTSQDAGNFLFPQLFSQFPNLVTWKKRNISVARKISDPHFVLRSWLLQNFLANQVEFLCGGVVENNISAPDQGLKNYKNKRNFAMQLRVFHECKLVTGACLE